MVPGIKKLRKKWQGQWAIIALVKNPEGGAVEFETDLPEDVAKKLLKTVAAQMNRKSLP